LCLFDKQMAVMARLDVGGARGAGLLLAPAAASA
jgi:hypothetical protein